MICIQRQRQRCRQRQIKIEHIQSVHKNSQRKTAKVKIRQDKDKRTRLIYRQTQLCCEEDGWCLSLKRLSQSLVASFVFVCLGLSASLSLSVYLSGRRSAAIPLLCLPCGFQIPIFEYVFRCFWMGLWRWMCFVVSFGTSLSMSWVSFCPPPRQDKRRTSWADNNTGQDYHKISWLIVPPSSIVSCTNPNPNPNPNPNLYPKP